ncbi:MAG: lamin tail domain-containing protein, partial [Candidatus Kerfeldbacteria bacterium]|nr:lamin tail domain-containing protein [Candidatus Kerfeldbacteria bacterium]
MRFKKFVAIGTVAAMFGAPMLSLQADLLPPRVVINELMWAGSATSASDEWIELRNFEDVPVDLGGWKLTRRTSGSDVTMLTIPAGLEIAARGFFLISNFSDMS